jgi:uncharacterized membrane protein YfcA
VLGTALLVVAALVAGVIDAIAGGGGLITLPALLAGTSGLPTVVALGTNKGQSVFGSGSALVAFWRAGSLDRGRARVTFPLGLVGSVAGAALVMVLPPAVLRPVVLALLVAAAAFLALRRPKAGAGAAEKRAIPAARARAIAAAIALVMGAYDGFFGPGVGTFLIVAFVGLLGEPLHRASGDAKVVNFASNLAAVAAFASRGAIIWRIALPMAAAQLVGGTIGAQIAVRGGERVVRRVVLVVVAGLVAKLAWDMVGAR